MMNTTQKLGLLLLVFALDIRLLTLPSAIGYTYAPAHFYNLYLPNLGVHSPTAILPGAFKTLPADYSFLKILIDVFRNPLLVYKLLYVLQPLLVFFSYYIFFKLVPHINESRFFLASLFSIFVYWPSEQYLVGSLILGMISIVGIMSGKKKFHVLGYISLITVSLYWHSASVLFGVFLFSLLLIRYLMVPTKTDIFNLLIVSLILMMVWLYVRGHYQQHVFYSLFSSLFNIFKYVNIKYLKMALFSKGIVAPPTFVYTRYTTIIKILNYMRYTGYGMVFIVVLLCPLIVYRCNKYGRALKLLAILSLSFVFGTIAHTILSFLTLMTIGPIVFIVFLFPFAVACLMLQYKMTRNKLYVFIVGYLLLTIGVSQAYYAYHIDIEMNPRFNENFEMYKIYALWIGEYAPRHGCFISDSATIGYIAIWFGRYKLYVSTLVHFESLDNTNYAELYNGLWGRQCFLIYNFDLYLRHLPFYSLQAWNRYEPLSPEGLLLKNSLNKIYDSNIIWILS